MAKAKTKTKFNKKIVMLVGGFVLFAVVVLGGVAYFTISGAPERNIRLGDAALVAAEAAEQAGDADKAYKLYQEALGRFGRAVSKRPNNLDYNQKMIDTLVRMTPKTSSDAQELYGKLERLFRKRTNAAPLDGKQWLLYLGTAADRARLFEDPGLWKDIVEVCDEALEKLPLDEPNRTTVEKVRLKAMLSMDTVLTSEERAAAEGAAREYLTLHPKAVDLWAALLMSQHVDATRLAFANRVAESKERTAAFSADLAKAEAAAPNDPAIAVVRLARLLSRAIARDPLVTPQAVTEVVAPLLWKNGDQASNEVGTISGADSASLLELARLVGMSTDPAYAAQLIKVLDGYTQARPAELLHLGSLAQAQSTAGMRAEARSTLSRLINVPRQRVSMLSAFQDDIRVTAAEKIFDLDFTDWENAKSPTEKATALDDMKKSRARLAELVAGREGELSITRAEAKIAYAAGDYLTAVTKLEEVFARSGSPAAELYALSAISLIERGELGAALIKIERGITEFPALPQFYLTRARVLGQLGRVTEAKRSLQQVLDRYPDLAEAQRMLAEIGKVPTDGSLAMSDMVVKILGDAELVAREGKVAEATVMLENALITYPKDVRIQRTIVQWLMFVGEMEKARVRLAEFIADHPADDILKQLQVLTVKDSPVDRAIAFVDLAPRTPEERAVEVLVSLFALRDNLKQGLATASPERKPLVEAELAKADAAITDAKAKAIELVPGDSAVIDRLMNDALKSKDYATADQVVALAEKSAVDRTLPALLRGRIALDREDWARAIEQFEIAQALPGAAAPGYRLLGIARERSGDIAGAREAYKAAYDRRPNDIAAVQLYSSLLARSGDMNGAREVLRAAMLAMPESAELRNVYLDIEGQFGSRADSMVERRRLYALRPSDVDNARQLMRILIEAAPSREFIINNDGSQKYTQADWDALSQERRDQELDALAQVSRAEADVIFERLLKMQGDNRLPARTYAASMQRAGRGREAEAKLKALAAAAPAATAWQSWLDIGELQSEDGRPAEAEESFAKSIALDPSATQAASAIAAYWSKQRRPALARKVLEAAFVAQPSSELARQLAAVQLEVRDFAAAKKSAAEVERLTQGKLSFEDRLLAADIANAEVELGFGNITPEQTRAAQTVFNEAIDAAIRTNPASPVPFIVRAGAEQRRFQRSGEPEALAAARSDVERAFELQANYWPTTRLRASIYSDEGDMASAIEVVRKFVAQNPRNVDARRALVGYYISAGDTTGAVDAVKTIMQVEPNNPVWIDALGEAYTAAAMYREAGQAYQQLAAVAGDLSLLTKSVIMRMKATPPDFAGILESLRTAKQETTTIPFLQMAGAAAIAIAGDNEVQRNQGVVQLREMYKMTGTNAGLVDAWATAVGSIYPADKPAEFEKFALAASNNQMTTALARNLSSRWAESGPSGNDKAIEYGRKAVELATDDNDRFFALLVLGGIQFSANDVAGAADSFGKALAIHPDNITTINNLAFIEASDPAKLVGAIERARMALAIDVANVDLMDTLGYALTKANQLPEAITHLMRAARMRPSAGIYAHLAAAQFAAGRTSESEESLRRAKALRPSAEAQRDIDAVQRTIDTAPTGG